MGLSNRHGAFIDTTLEVRPLGSGRLDGNVFTVKDVFAIRGHVSSAGNPDWLRSHPPASEHAEAIECLLYEGATLKGATHTDELMYSLGGENIHYGTPMNPRAKGRIPGGSSSGSAVAVSSGIVDFALGTDTGGSVRVPSSYCGIYGFRPSHRAVGMNGVIPLAPRFDTVGWMAASPELLLRVGEVLLGKTKTLSEQASGIKKLFIASDAWAMADPEYSDGWSGGLKLLQAGASSCKEIRIASEGLETWMNVFRDLQGSQIWEMHGEWIRKETPVFASEIADRFALAEQLSQKDHTKAESLQKDITLRLSEQLGGDGVLVIPTVPGPAPLAGGSASTLEQNRNGALSLCCIAGLSGFPQITLPIKGPDGLPLGLSVIAASGQDLRLLSWIQEIWKTEFL